MKNRAEQAALTGILAALALSLSFLEGLLPPLPMAPPGFKLGLSNIVTMYAAGSLGLGAALFLALLKAGFACFTRGLAAGLMSLSGGVCSAVCMWALWKSKRASLAVIGVCGALCHNFAQLLAARLITSTPVLFYVPFLLLFGLVTGLLTGAVLKLTLPPLERLELALGRIAKSGKNRYNKG